MMLQKVSNYFFHLVLWILLLIYSWIEPTKAIKCVS